MSSATASHIIPRLTAFASQHGVQVLSSDASTSFAGAPTTRFALALHADPSKSLLLELSDSFDVDNPEFAEQLNIFVGDLARRLRNPIPTAILTLGGLPLTYTHFEWPFHESTAGADTSLVHGQVNLAVPDAEGKPSPLHAKIAAAMTVTFREIVRAPEQPFSESFILNAVRKTFDQGQLELVKSGNRQPVPVTTRYYSPWQKRFSFNDTTEAQRRQYLAAKAFWFSAVLGGAAAGQPAAPVWLADPRDAQYLNTTPDDLKKSAAALAKEGYVTLAKDTEFAAATPALAARAAEFQAQLAEALAFIKPTFNEDMRGGHTNM
jgi:hypothetical protein